MDILMNYYKDWSLRTKKNKGEMILSFGLQALISLLASWIIFYLMGLRYHFFKALLVGLTSILPLASSGILLVPWAGLRFFQQDLTVAGRLALAYVLLTIGLKIIKPYLLGKTEGLRPYLYFLIFLILYLVFYIGGAVLSAFLILVLAAWFEWVEIRRANRRYKRFIARHQATSQE